VADVVAPLLPTAAEIVGLLGTGEVAARLDGLERGLAALTRVVRAVAVDVTELRHTVG
jgi:hypothetical protein